MSTPLSSPVYITPPVAAALLGVSGRTVHRWHAQGVIRGWLTPGGRLRVDPRSIEPLLKAASAAGVV